MNQLFTKHSIVLTLCAFFLFSACNKSTSDVKQGSFELREAGLLPSDSARISQLPLIVSKSFLQTKDFQIFAAKRKSTKSPTPVDTTTTTTPITSPTPTEPTVIAPTTLPYSHSLNMPPVLNQGSEGSCVSFAVGYAARSADYYYKTRATSYSQANNIFSPEFLFNQTTTSSSCTGSSVITALDFVVNNGICTWQSMPYSSSNGCSLLPTSLQKAEAGNYKINSYSIIKTSDITAMKSMLASNRPLVVSATIDNNFYNAKPGFIWKYFSTTYIGHAFVICGYDDAKNAYKVMNSWGTTWGDAGYSWIDYHFFPSVTSMVFVLNS